MLTRVDGSVIRASFATAKRDEARLREMYAEARRGGWSWRAAGACLGLAGGSGAPVVGALLLSVGWALGGGIAGRALHLAGSALLISTIPLLLAGAHCLDLLERRAGKSRGLTLVNPTLSLKISGKRSAHLRAHLNVIAVAVFLTLLCAGSSRAQQTIFNVPTTDVLGRGKVYAELDASFKPNDSDAVPRFSSFVPRVVAGAGHSVELGLNVIGNVQPGPDATTLVPTFKFKAYDGGKNGWAVVAGDHLFFPVRNRAYTAGNYVYAEASKTFKRGTRLTAGAYDFTRHVVAGANRAGGQFGFEQPAGKKVTFAADYFTGRHAAGYFTPGVVFKIGGRTTGYAGYSIGNQNPSRGNNFFLLELGYNFN